MGVEFDPGFGPHIMAFGGTVEYLYADINRFKNFSQRKMKFRGYYKKILEVFNNNLGFYIGCLMWASYIKTLDKQEILNNHCLGKTYTDEENTSETDFMIKFTELFPKDMKYFLSESFAFDNSVPVILNLYKEFLLINKGFVDSKYNTDIKLPEKLITKDSGSFNDIIQKVIETSDLSKFIEYKNLIVQ